jgi:hypothetical protein
LDELGHHGSFTVAVIPTLDLVGGQHLGRAILAGAEAFATVALS